MSESHAGRLDAHSHARPWEARVTHLSLALAVDFHARRLSGRAVLEVAAETAEAVTLTLDVRGLAIHAIATEGGEPLEYELGESDPIVGAPLRVRLPAGVRRVAVTYSTEPGADALQWLAPEQTFGGVHPLLFTQGQPIYARTWLPVQDSPGVRLTFDARITVPAGLVALMGAEQLGPVDDPHAPDGTVTFGFRMPVPIPAYLVALAVGDLGRRELGPRTAVFAEPTVLDRAAYELAEVESMLAAAESLVGPYLWGRWDVVIMPPSFPFGGMENPRLTFASPTLLAGDRSLTTVFAHELAHAWAGNLVVNATWRDFWLNEGTTVYLELRLNEALWGAERAGLLRSWGHLELEGAVSRMGAAHPDTRLRYDLAGRDPADGVTVIPYLKGAAFFWALEDVVGRARLDAWLRGWFERQAFRSVTTADLLASVREHLFTDAERAAPPVDLAAWTDEPGLPPVAAPALHPRLSRIDAAAKAVLAGASPRGLDVAEWIPQEWRHFLTALVAGAPSLALLDSLDAAFALSTSGNAEVLAPWLRLEARAERREAEGRIEAFLLGTGRLKFLRPLYADLLTSPWGDALARRVYATARPRYHALSRSSLDRLLGVAA
jgi:leukotriene-A4 hydrolase